MRAKKAVHKRKIGVKAKQNALSIKKSGNAAHKSSLIRNKKGPLQKSARKISPARTINSIKHNLFVADKKIGVQNEENPMLFAPKSYENALLAEILSSPIDNDAEMVDEASLLFNQMLSSLSSSLRDAQFRYGLYLGRMLHRMCMQKRNPVYDLNPNIALVEFLDNSGYKYIINRSFEEIYRFDMSGPAKCRIGVNAHVLESGIISGFISASEKRFVRISEKECTSNGGAICSFSSEQPVGERHANIDSILENFSSYMIGRVHSNALKRSIKKSYFGLSWNSIANKRYSDELGQIAYFFGNRLSKELMKRGNPDIYKNLENTTRLLNLGALKIVKEKPFSATLDFDLYTSKKFFADISTSFVAGFLEAEGIKNLNVNGAVENGAYVLNIKQDTKKT